MFIGLTTCQLGMGERVTEVLYLFKGATGLADRNAPGLVYVEKVFKILCAHPLNVHGSHNL
jgi:hypothetical protein